MDQFSLINFQVICDSNNNIDETIDQNALVVDILLPILNAQWVQRNMQWTQGWLDEEFVNLELDLLLAPPPPDYLAITRTIAQGGSVEPMNETE